MVAEKKDTLYVRIPVKPYCYRYLCNNFGVTGKKEGYISLRRNRLLSMVFRSLLHHKTRLIDVPQQSARWRTREVFVAVSSHDLEHHGLDLTEEGKCEWALLVEQLCQEDFKQFFIQMYMVEPRVKNIIENFHTVRGYTEEDWPVESLQKIITRMQITSQMRKVREEYLEKFYAFFTAKLSKRVDTQITKNLLRQCDSTSTTGEESPASTLSQLGISATSERTGALAQ